MELVPPFVPPLVDHACYFRHAPARLRVVANMYGCAFGYAAVCLLRPLWSAKGGTQAECGVRLAVWGLQRTSTPQSQAQSCRSYWVAPTIECI